MGSGFAIELRGVTKRYPPSVIALDSVSLAIQSGSMVGFLGPNGSGKTTTVKILAGLIGTFEGDVTLEGMTLPQRQTARLLGYMPQQVALYSELSVFQNLDFFGAINGVTSGTRRRAFIDETLDLLDLADKKYRPVASLSGGMKQRVSLGCAILHRPRVLLLDEPTVGLDPELRLAFWGHFRQMAAAGATVLICTHAFDEARHCSHLAFLKAGKLLRYGSREELAGGSAVVDWEAVYMAHVTRAAEGDEA